MKRKLDDTDIESISVNTNFTELKNLVAFVSDVLLPKISDLESQVRGLQDMVEEMTERAEHRKRPVPNVTPRFFLGIEEDSDNESYVAFN